MSSSRRSRPVATWKKLVSHRRLMVTETVLLVGAAGKWCEGQLMEHPAIPVCLKIICTMVLVLGVLGSMVLLVRRFAFASVEKAHGMLQSLPLPTPLYLIHAVVFFALYMLYAWVLGLRPW